MNVNLRPPIGKLNPAMRNRTEAAAGLCLTRTHSDVEVEHFPIKLLNSVGTDLAAIARHAEMDTARVATALNRALDRFKTGNGRRPAMSPDLVEMLTQAWTVASIDFEVQQIRTGFAVLAPESLPASQPDRSLPPETSSFHLAIKETPSVVSPLRCARIAPSVIGRHFRVSRPTLALSAGLAA
jgi:ATP-dependent Clp protease ATP-binding subunit ClpA